MEIVAMKTQHQTGLRENIWEDVIRNLTAIRKKKRISQADVESITGIPQSSIARIEKLNVSPKLETVAKIAQAIGYEITWSQSTEKES